MKFKLRCYLILTLAVISVTSSAQNITVMDTSAPEDRLVNPTIVMTPGTVTPNCDTYTGCGLIVLKVHHYQKPKRHRVHHYQSCCSCYVRTEGQCY